MKKFFEKHGSGFWLHGLGALVIMLVSIYFGYAIIGLIVNCILWPVRELWQHRVDRDGMWNEFVSFHVMLEWGTPIIVSLICFLIGALI